MIENNLENAKEKPLGMTDAEYVEAVDNGTHDFVWDQAGFGIFQLTFWSRKKAYLDLVRKNGVSIADVNAQLLYFQKEMTEDFSSLYNLLRISNDVKECSDAFMTIFENPADKSAAKKQERYEKSMKYFIQFSTSSASSPAPSTGKFPPDLSIMLIQTVLNYNGYRCRSDGYKDEEFYKQLREFVADIGG